MSKGYESLIGRVKEDLRDIAGVTEEDIIESVEAESIRCRRRYEITDEDIQKAISELLYFYAVTITDEDSELFETRIRSTWWTDSYETRKKADYYHSGADAAAGTDRNSVMEQTSRPASHTLECGRRS